MGVNTQPAIQQINQLPQHVKNALNQASTHTTSFSESFGKLFSRGDIGERRFHSLIGSIIRDMSSAQGGAEGLAQGMASIFERINVGGTAAGAGLVAIGVGIERLVAHGEELRKTNSDIEKSTQQMEHALKLSTAAEGYSALASKARDFHKDERKAHDEAAKDQEHLVRLFSRRAEYVFRHPFSSGGMDKAISQESGKAREAAARAAAAVRKEDELSLVALERGAEVSKAQLSGSEEQVAQLKLASEYEQRSAEIKVMSARSGHGDEAMAALNTEIELRQRMIQAQAQQREREFQAQMKQGQLARQQAADEGRVADIQISALTIEEKALETARARSDVAVDRIESAQAEVRAAEDELEASKSLTLEEQRRAQLGLQNAQTAEAEARTAAKGAAAGVADERAKAIQQGAAERRLSPEEQRKQYRDRQKDYESIVQELTHRGISSDLAQPPRMGEAEYDPLRKFKAAASSDEMQRQGGKLSEKLQREYTSATQHEGASGAIVDAVKQGADRIVTAIQGGSGGRGAPSGQPPITPGQPQPQVGGGGSSVGPQSNADAFTNYWARPDVQAGVAGQNQMGAEAAAAGPLSQNDINQMSTPVPYAGPDYSKPENDRPLPENAPTEPYAPQPPPPAAQPSALPSPPREGGNGADKGVVNAIEAAIDRVMSKYWR
jgi:hypothetical protein